MSKTVIVLTYIGVFLCGSFAHAQTSGEIADSLQLDPLVITASKIPLTQRETTKPVLVIDRQQIERSTGKDLSRLLNEQSGLRVNGTHGAPGEVKSLFLQGAGNDYTLILIDGIAVSDPSGVGGVYDLRLLPLDHIERIEVTKGSQSTLYGTDAIGGVVNIITKKGEESPFNTSGSLSYGSYNSFDGSIGVNGELNNTFNYTFTYSRESTDGFSAATDRDDTGSFGDDGFTRDAFYGKVALKPVEGITVSPFLGYSAFKGDYDASAFQDADNTFETDLINPGIQIDATIGDFRVNGGYHFAQTDRAFTSFNSFTEEWETNKFEGRFHNADLFGTWAFTDNLQILGGVNYQSNILPGEETDEDTGESIQTDFSTQIWSPYATLFLKNWNGLNAELGYRLNNHSGYGNNSTFSLSPSYNVTGRVKLFASVSTGFKAPTVSELFGPFGANSDLDPEKSTHYAIGAEAFLLNHSLKISTHYFSREIEDVIVWAAPGMYMNLDEQNDHGFELSTNWIVNPYLTVGAHYNYLDGEVTTLNDEGEEETSGNLIRRPKHSIGASIGLQATEKLFLSLQGEYNGERTDIFFNPETFENEEVTLDPYTFFSFYSEYKLLDNRLTLFADIRNLLNTDFTEVYGYNTTGFALKGGVRFGF